MLRTVSLALGLAAFAAAAPVRDASVAPLEKRANCASTSSENAGTFSQPCDVYTSAVTCPKGIQGKAGGIVLAVHGTGSTGAESWGSGPYVYNLPTAGPGFDVCYVDLPQRSLIDAQVSAEYVAYNIYDLAKKSATGKVSLISHSQGGPNVQWALDFWPAYRPLVNAFFAIAPDFHGTAEGPLACTVEKLTSGGCNPSVIQQSVGSHFLAAMNAKGDQALVPTTVAYTRYDEVIQPEVNPVTSRLSGASVHAVQDLDVCGPAYPADHLSMIVSRAAYTLGLDALTHNGIASTSRFDKSSCWWPAGDIVMLNDFNRTVAFVKSGLIDVASIATGPKTTTEPLLMPYVCARGDASSYCS
ncbi:hypothetical protein JCM10212_005721 [Sporobolomyces blumeae]